MGVLLWTRLLPTSPNDYKNSTTLARGPRHCLCLLRLIKFTPIEHQHCYLQANSHRRDHCHQASPLIMLYSSVLFAAAGFSGLASALNYSTSGPLSIDATQIDATLRQSWCRGQTNNCPLICGDGRASPNSCDATALTYVCTCTNGNTPNISDYAATLPSYICGQWIANCDLNHPNDRTGQAGCESVKCGTKNASQAYTVGGSASTTSAPSSITSAASTTSGTTTVTAATTTTTRAGAMAMHVAENYGTGIMAAGVLAAVGLVL